MESKSLRMNASASPELPVSPREFKRRVKSLTNLEDPTPKKYIHVHHFKNTKLYGAWFNDPSKPGKKVRLFFGSHLTAYLAARAQDRAALKYKPYALDPRSIKLNFKEEDYDADQKLRETLTCEEFGELLRKESRPKYTKMEPTPCLCKFMAHERARGNIPSAVPPKEEDIISLRQYLKEVIRKREQPAEDMEDPVFTDEDSSEDPESSDEEMDDPVPTAEQKKHALKVERKKRSEGKRIVVKFTQPRTPRSPVAGPSECKPVVTAPARLVWGQTRKRTKRHEDEYDQLQNKFHKLQVDSTEKSREPAPPTKPEGLPTEVQNTKSLEGAPSEAEGLPSEVENTKSPVGAPIEPEGLPTEVENTKSAPEPGNVGLPQSPELQFRSKWHYQMHKIQKLQTSRTSAELLPAEVENTKTPEPGTEGIRRSPESPKLQFRSKWHYKLHQIQKLQTSRTSEPSPIAKNVESSYLQAGSTYSMGMYTGNYSIVTDCLLVQ